MKETTEHPYIEPAEESFESDVAELLRAVNSTLKAIGVNHPCYARLTEAAANVEAHFETDDPRAMGWVGSNGLP